MANSLSDRGSGGPSSWGRGRFERLRGPPDPPDGRATARSARTRRPPGTRVLERLRMPPSDPTPRRLAR